MNQQQLDPVSAATAILAIALGPTLAAIIGPYAVILIGASLGAAWSLGSRDPFTSRASALLFFAKMNFTAALVTVPLATLARAWGTPVDAHWLIVPIAILVGGVGEEWPAVGRFVVERLGRLVDRKIDTSTGK